MMIMPNPAKTKAKYTEKVIVFKELYCPNGHNLINRRADFNGAAGILIQARSTATIKKGMLALSPIYGEKIRIALDVDLEKDELLSLACPVCQAELPTYGKCECNAELKALFLTKDMDFSNCIGICNRVDCKHARLINSGELVSLAAVDAL